MKSLCSGQGLLRERWCCARGWWMLAGGHRIIRRRYMKPHCIIVSSYPTSWAYSRNIQSHAQNHTTNTTLTSVSTIGGGRDTTISSPGRSPKQPFPGIGLHDSLHGRQACPNSAHFTRRLVKQVPGRGYFHAVPSPKRGQICDIPAPSTVERLSHKQLNQ